MQDRASFLRFLPLAAFASWLAGMLSAGFVPSLMTEAACFLVPGALLAWASMRLPRHSAMARIGGWLLLLSALAFAAQGLFAFDLADPDGGASRLRALAWSLWWIAFAPGALLHGLSRGRGLLAVSLVAVALVLLPALWPLPRDALPLALILAAVAWFAWWAFAAWRPAALSRSAA